MLYAFLYKRQECRLNILLKDTGLERIKAGGALAKSLGIKPGSKEFHALKNGNDFYDDKGKDKGKSKDKGQGKGKGKSKG